MKRPMLISSITIATVCAFLMLFSKIAAIVAIMLAVSVFVLYLLKPLNLRKYIFIPVICVSSVLISLSFLAYTSQVIDPCLEYDNQTAYISGKIITSPVSENGYTTFVLQSENITGKNDTVKMDVILSQDKSDELKLYDFISIESAELSVKKNENNRLDLSDASDGIILTAESDNALFLWHAQRNPLYYCLRLKEIISERISSFMNTDTSGLLKGMLFGDNTDIEHSTLDAFRSSGIAHLLAVSGLHTSLWCGLLIMLLDLFRVPEKIRSVVCIFFLAGFCAISAFTPSVIRASLMMLILLVAPFFKRKPDSLNSLGFAVTCLLLNNPYAILSVSFLLSVTSTLGVLLASRYEVKIKKKTTDIKFKPFKQICDYIVCSLLISISAGIFTLPVSSYYFNVFSIASPLTNILCVKTAFYGMISGTVATGLSFINNTHIKDIAIFVFDISEYILNVVIKISKEISAFNYCTVPVHQKWLLYGIITATLLIITGSVIYKRKHNKNVFRIITLTALICLIINISVPVIPTRYSNTLTVIADENNMHLVIRSGTHYMYIVNSTESAPSAIYNYLPKASCESFDYYLTTYLSYNSVYDLEGVTRTIKPNETYITPSIKYIAQKKNIELPSDTVVSVTGEYTLNSKINIEIVDTYRMKYVIIKGNEKTVYIHLHGNTDFSDVVDTEPGNVFIYNGTLPDKIPKNAETLIINSGSEIITDTKLPVIKEYFREVFVTAEYGDVQIII